MQMQTSVTPKKGLPFKKRHHANIQNSNIDLGSTAINMLKKKKKDLVCQSLHKFEYKQYNQGLKEIPFKFWT